MDQRFFCSRCNKSLALGRGGFFEVSMQSVADPYSPVMDAEELEIIQQKLRDLLEKMNATSSVEAMEGVAEHRVFQLCNPCYQGLIHFVDGTPQ